MAYARASARGPLQTPVASRPAASADAWPQWECGSTKIRSERATNILCVDKYRRHIVIFVCQMKFEVCGTLQLLQSRCRGGGMARSLCPSVSLLSAWLVPSRLSPLRRGYRKGRTLAVRDIQQAPDQRWQSATRRAQSRQTPQSEMLRHFMVAPANQHFPA